MLRKDSDFLLLKMTAEQKQNIQQRLAECKNQQIIIDQQIQLEELKEKAFVEKIFPSQVNPFSKNKN